MDDLGFVPDSQTQDHSDLGFVPTPPPEPDMGPAKKVFDQNIAAYRASDKFKEVNPEQHEANDFLDDWLAGWQMSTTALGITRQKMPDTVLPQDATRAARIISSAGNIAGDLPAMFAGGAVGGTAGAAAGTATLPVVGTVGFGAVGAGAGAFALPAAMRKVLIDHYQKGDIKSFEDFYDRASGTFLDSLKGAATGAATAIAGPLVGKALPLAAGPLTKLGATSAAELATMTTVGKALDGKVPTSDDFIDNALLLGAFHGVNRAVEPLAKPMADAITNHIQNKLQDTYVKTGIHPADMYDMATKDPVLHQELLSDDPTLPSSLDKARSPGGEDPKMVTIKPDNSELSEMHPTLNDATKNEGPGQLKVEPTKESTQTASAITRTESEQKVLSRIGTPEEPPKNKVTFDQIYYNTVDKFDPIKVATDALTDGKVLSPKDDPYAMVRSMSANGRRAEAAIEAGPANFKDLTPTGTPGLQKTLEPFKDDLDGFRAYAISKRALELESQGKEHGIDVAAAKDVVKTGESKYSEAFKNFQNFNNDVLKYGRDSGLISKDSYDTILEHNKNYVSFRRVLGEDQGPNVKGTGAGLNVSNPIKELKGSTKEIVDPIESTLRNTQSIINLAEKNRAVLALTELIDKAKNPELGQKISTPKKAVEVSEAEAAQFLKSKGLDPEDAAAFTVFKNKSDLEDNQIASYKDGKRQIYEVPQILADSVRQLDPQTVSIISEYGRIPADMLRTGMIASPAFQARHFIRQEAMSTIFGKDTYIPIATTLKGLGNLLGKSEPFYEWLRGGGANDSIASIGETLGQKYFDLDKETGFLSKGFNVIKSPLQSLKMITQYLDEARTLGKFINAREAGKDIFQSSLEARDSAIDASRVGAAMRGYNMVVPFANMRIQGLDLIGRNFKEDPVNTFLKLGSTITIPSALLWYANKDDDRWREIPNYIKDTSWLFMTKDHIYRVPKPFEPGIVFGSLPERVLESYFTDNPAAFKDFQKTMFESAMPQIVPTYATPFREQWGNKSIMTGAPLISDHMKNVLPEYQSNPYTSTTGKVIAGALRQIPTDITNKPGSFGSPIIVDNYVREWGGDVGQFTLQALDLALEKSGAAKSLGVDYNQNPPAKTLSDIPFIKAFTVRYPSANPQSLTNFFDKFETIQTRLNSISLLRQQGRYEDMAKEQNNSLALNQFTNLPAFKQAITNDLHLVQTIYKDPSMDANEKRQAIDLTYTKMLNEAKRANELLDDISKLVPKEK